MFKQVERPCGADVNQFDLFIKYVDTNVYKQNDYCVFMLYSQLHHSKSKCRFTLCFGYVYSRTYCHFYTFFDFCGQFYS